jgi:hypothetical protein
MADFKTYNSFSGIDIHAMFGNYEFGELQMVSYKIDRERAPVYVMGSPELRTIARGKRIISGGCVFVVFQKDGLLEAMSTNKNDYPYISVQENANYDAQGKFKAPAGGSINAFNGAQQGTNYSAAKTTANDLNIQTKPRYNDQLMPFDIVLYGANEYGQASKMSILQVEIMSEAGGMSIDDLVIEKQMSFIARALTSWELVQGRSAGRFSAETTPGIPTI